MKIPKMIRDQKAILELIESFEEKRTLEVL